MFSRLLGISPSLLKKLLIVASGGGSSVFYFGFPESQVAGANRKIKWTLINGAGEESNKSIDRKNSKWVVERRGSWQGLDINEWDKVSDENVKTIYKLIIKKEWIENGQGVQSSEGIKGTFGLFKVSLKNSGRGEKETYLEEVTGEEAKAIWLIVARGSKTVYLIPVVKASTANNKLGRWSGANNSCWEGVNKIWESGVTNFNDWKGDGDLGAEEIQELERNIKNGFVIGRGGKGYGGSFGWGSQRSRGSSIDSFTEQKAGQPRGHVVVYKNAGILAGREKRDQVCKKENKEIRYFPLDIKAIGKTGLKEIKGRSKATWSEIEVNETIENVGIFKWEKLRVSETGIGDGVGKDVIWGADNKLTWTPELLK